MTFSIFSQDFKKAPILLVLWLLGPLIVVGCDRGTHAHGPQGEHLASTPSPSASSHSEEEPLARTEFSKRLENFFEFDALKPGEASQFLIHLTDLKTGKPVKDGKVVLHVRGSNGMEIQSTEAKVGKVTGIYVAQLKIKESGTYGIDFTVKNDILDETMSLKNFEVSANPAPASEEEPAQAGPTVAFLMEQQWLIDMTLAEAVQNDFAQPISSTGRVVPAANSHAIVSSPVPGKITGRNLPRVGQEVALDQTLVVVQEFSTVGEEAQVRAALAQVKAAQIQTEAQLKSQNATLRNQNAQSLVENARLASEKRELAGAVDVSRTEFEHARHEVERAREVYKIEAISEKELHVFEEGYQKAKATLNANLARQKALGKARAVPQAALLSESVSGVGVNSPGGTLTLTAPLSGTLTKVHKALGEHVDSGEAIVEVTHLDPVWLESPVFEADLGKLSQGMKATFSVLSFPDREFQGTLLNIGSVIDEKTRAATVLFRVDNPDRALRLGMQADIRLDGRETVSATLIPKDALLDRDGKKIVYVLLSGEEFQRRQVTVGQDLGNRVAVTSGLKPGERVVSQGAYQLFLQETDPADAGVHSHET